MPYNYIIEGLDRVGKSSLIEGILNKEGYHQVIHFSKPKKLDHYVDISGDIESISPEQLYQQDSFIAMFELLESHLETPFIFDRAHLGECVYSPMYRGYSGDYVFTIEESVSDEGLEGTRLILLIEDFSKSKHFVDDGQSLGTSDKREAEQKLFVEAFNKSIFPDKKIICVTAEDGSFRSKEDILAEATAD